MNYIIGIDIGTTNTKAVAYDTEGRALHQFNKSYSFISEQEGYHELDPKVLFDAFIEVIANVISQTTTHELCGVSFSAAMHGLMAVDNKGTALTNMITWADLRSNSYAVHLKNSSEGKKIYERTGTPIHPMSPLCKLMWMKDHLPQIFNAAHKFISIKEYIFFHLFGEFVIDRSVASSTGLLDIYTREWNEDALRVAGITADRLSTPVDATFILHGIKSPIKNVPDVPFIIGASDGCLAHLGSNAMKEGDISLTIGTSGAVRIVTDKPVYDPRQRIFNYLFTDNFYLSGGPVNNGGNVLQWFAKGFLNEDFTTPENFESFIDEAFEIPPGCEGLIFLPYIYGERAPVWDANARGIFYGVSSIHTKAHFMRAILEGVSFGLYSIYKSLDDIAGPVNNIYASGGFIRSKKWVGLIAGIFGKKLFISQSEDSSAAGAAIIGLKALGKIKDLMEPRSFFSEVESFEPDMEHHDVYQLNYEVYSTLYEKFKEIKP